MGFRDGFKKRYTDAYLKRYGDRLTQVQGKVLSIKIEKKTILFILNKILVNIVVKPDGSKNVIKCVFKKRRWFKKIKFITVSQGHNVIIQGMKSKKSKKIKENKEHIEIVNVRNLTTKKDLVPIEGEQKVQRVRMNNNKFK